MMFHGFGKEACRQADRQTNKTSPTTKHANQELNIYLRQSLKFRKVNIASLLL